LATIKYIANQVISGDSSINDFRSDKEKELIENFSINTLYDQAKHRIEVNIFSLDRTLQYTDTNYTNLKQDSQAAGAGKDGASNLSLDPVADALLYGYDTGDIVLEYNFYNNLFSSSKLGGKLFIESISPDKTEIRALSNELSTQQLVAYTNELKRKLNNAAYFSEFLLNFGEGQTSVGLNIELESTAKGQAVVFKLYEPVGGNAELNSSFLVEEIVSDSVSFEILAEVEDDIIKVPFLKGPNFNVEVNEKENTPTEFFNFNELFSFPVTGSYYELRSLFNEKSAQIAINHSDYSDFIHFSSAEERLRNFKYKLDLIQSYEESIDSLDLDGANTTSGSKEYYKGLIDGLVSNFDHYDRFLFYESSSHAWPKSNTSKPYTNIPSDTTQASTWYTEQLLIASNYDNTNFDILTNTVPTYIREDVNNEPYLMFIHMIAQHFDNLWIYFKAVSDKYDADNRLNFGVSKDLVRSAVESFGIKLYSSNFNTGDLFAMLSGEALSSGSELITSQSIATISGSAEQLLAPISQNDYQKEIYKRLYHNLPFLLKTKGTERGLRALINCFGIPPEILEIKQFGGIYSNQTKHLGPLTHISSSIDKIRLDNTGSLVTGSTLSVFTSIVRPEQKTSDDSHTIEVGFNFSDLVNRYIKLRVSSSFNIDNYIGDPSLNYEREYEDLNDFGTKVTRHTINWEDIVHLWAELNPNESPYVEADWKWDERLTYYRDPKAFIRLIRFFDNSIFRTIKDFIPARSNVNTGVILQSHALHRSKAKQVQLSVEQQELTSSIDMVSISGSNGGTFVTDTSIPYTTKYQAEMVSPLGVIPRNVLDESPTYNGEFSGSVITISTRELNIQNTFKHPNQPETLFNIALYNLSVGLPPSCAIIMEGTYIGEYFEFKAVSNGTVGVTYPTTISQTASTIKYTSDFNVYEYITITAVATYPFTFVGWYTEEVGGTLITASSTLNIYNEDELTNSNQYFARFS
jgi:hypothetical protein